MTKSTVSRLFWGSLIAVILGGVLLAAAVLLAYGNGSFIMSGPDVTGINPSPFGWSMVVLAVVGVLAMIGGAIGQLVAWIGAVLNTSNLADRTWFIVLLIMGILSVGFVAMLVYVLVGPDGTRVASGHAPQAQGAAG